MKTKVLFLTLLSFTLSFSTLKVNAATDPLPADEQMTKEEYQLALEQLEERVDVLKEAKKDATTKAEKEAIRSEIKDVKEEAKALKQQAMSGGIYIGGGALLVIVLLLILL
ncbi:hypothetical protein PZB74_06850 [Porifericola rhodea]|uniref:hypothetical protein n=1 Tax=Porifericola rhodea TaxID=930972 RepID=UPI002665A61E|nr:hypothetical protein [Porifericola rhodea]WKN33061.1 hypothetical protein PZB74_06850 [Porifericola rhodea]